MSTVELLPGANLRWVGGQLQIGMNENSPLKGWQPTAPEPQPGGLASRTFPWINLSTLDMIAVRVGRVGVG